MIKLKDLDSSKELVVIANHKESTYRAVGVNNLHLVEAEVEYRTLKRNIERFIKYAKARPTMKFWVTSTLGSAIDLAPMFAHAPKNCVLPHRWKDIMGDDGRQWWYA